MNGPLDWLLLIGFLSFLASVALGLSVDSRTPNTPAWKWRHIALISSGVFLLLTFGFVELWEYVNEGDSLGLFPSLIMISVGVFTIASSGRQLLQPSAKQNKLLLLYTPFSALTSGWFFYDLASTYQQHATIDWANIFSGSLFAYITIAIIWSNRSKNAQA